MEHLLVYILGYMQWPHNQETYFYPVDTRPVQQSLFLFTSNACCPFWSADRWFKYCGHIRPKNKRTNEQTNKQTNPKKGDADCVSTHTPYYSHCGRYRLACTVSSTAMWPSLCYILLWAASLTTGNKGSIEQRQRRGALMGNLHAFVEGNWSWVKGNRCN